MNQRNAVRVLVLCAGNIGRSPLAEVLLKHSVAEALGIPETDLAEAGVVVRSAGTEAPEGYAASARGVAIASELGLDLSNHKATLLTKTALAEADLVYVMDKEHLSAVAQLLPEAAGRTLLWAGEGSEVPDPHHMSDEFFRDVFAQIRAALPAVTARVVARLKS